MSYYKDLKDFILELRGSYFLSPRDRWFLKFLEEEGYPKEVVKEGIKKFFLFFPPEKRAKLPLFMSYKEIKKLNKYHIPKGSFDWRERFYKKLQIAKEFIDITPFEPEDIKSAEEFLQSLERQIAQKLWDGLSKEEKTEIMRKFSAFKEDKELLKAMIKRELFKRVGLRGLSLFLE